MTATATNLLEFFRAEELRERHLGRETPTLAWIADVLRASGATLFDESIQEDQTRDVAPVSGRRVRAHASERMRSVFSIGQVRAESLGLDTENGADVSVPELRGAFDALVEIGDFIEVSGGRIYPSRQRLVQFSDSLWGVVSGSPSADLALTPSTMFGTSVLRVIPTHPGCGHVEQRLSDWLGVRSLNYAEFARDQLARAIPPMREDASSWFVANVMGPMTDWVLASKWSDFDRPLVVRRRREETGAWERFVARLTPGIHAVECVAARQISYHDCSRIIHGQKMTLGFGRVLRSQPSDWGNTVTCDTHELPEVRRILLALSHDCLERGDRHSFVVATALVPHVEAALAKIGIRLIPFR